MSMEYGLILNKNKNDEKKDREIMINEKDFCFLSWFPSSSGLAFHSRIYNFPFLKKYNNKMVYVYAHCFCFLLVSQTAPLSFFFLWLLWHWTYMLQTSCIWILWKSLSFSFSMKFFSRKKKKKLVGSKKSDAYLWNYKNQESIANFFCIVVIYELCFVLL